MQSTLLSKKKKKKKRKASENRTDAIPVPWLLISCKAKRHLTVIKWYVCDEKDGGGVSSGRMYPREEVSKDLPGEVTWNSSPEWSWFCQDRRERGRNVPGHRSNMAFGFKQHLSNTMCMG